MKKSNYIVFIGLFLASMGYANAQIEYSTPNSFKYKNHYFRKDSPSITQSNIELIRLDSTTAAERMLKTITQLGTLYPFDHNRYKNYVKHKVYDIPQGVDSLVFNVYWLVFKDDLYVFLREFKFYQNGKAKTFNVYINQNEDSLGTYKLLDYLINFKEKIINEISQGNHFELQDLSMITSYSAHSRHEKKKCPPCDNDTTKIYQGIEAYTIREDVYGLTFQLDSIKKIIVDSQEINERLFCVYNPHHYYKFYNSYGRNLGYFELCFECGEFSLSIPEIGFKRFGSSADFKFLKKHLRSVGIRKMYK